MSRLVTLLTDFGTQDPFVGVMKGVLLALAPEARLVDLTHEIPPQRVAAGRFWLERCHAYFPADTVHLAVVDPGVGTARRALALRAQGQFFVGPDNGLLAPFLAQAESVYELSQAVSFSRLIGALPSARPASATFHGRDVFAPAAALLAAGLPLADLGTPLAEPAVEGLSSVEPSRVEVSDRFGNLITNVDRHPSDGAAKVEIAGQVLRWVRTYGEAAPGECVALLGSFGTVEIAVRDGSAAERLGLGPGAPVTVRDVSGR